MGGPNDARTKAAGIALTRERPRVKLQPHLHAQDERLRLPRPVAPFAPESAVFPVERDGPASAVKSSLQNEEVRTRKAKTGRCREREPIAEDDADSQEEEQ